MTRADLKVTADDYRALPEGGPRHQLVDGELIRLTPAPSYRHQALVWELGSRLRGHVRDDALGDVVGAPVDVYLSELDVFQPDVLFVAREHLDRIADDGVHGAPDLVVEVLSPSTRQLDLGAKRKTYARHGVAEYWVVDPEAQAVTVHDLRAGSPPRTLTGDAPLTSALLPGFALQVGELFRAV
ncbi:MAG: Uma2 family endonuclease [Planctomycetes bacterium]|nr:Uma2 family endonuclease [Planctomycetota bacterium]